MNPSNPLANLRDIHTPEAIGWWPMAPLWWLLIALLMLSLAALLYLWLRRRQRNRYRALAKSELGTLASIEDNKALARAINDLLKRTAIHAYGADCATLYGERWLRFLDASLDGGQAFSQGPGSALGMNSYRPRPDIERQALLELTQRWLGQHRRTAPAINQTAGQEASRV
ncbi:DUF4381 domain-containing protein [Gilvimarinus algae]|uniref:DUF4381 domain-containing protein n=1 Tax=Gilvimarinus algae TaxID=3058037 RepID=A0ABT8TDN3_9GAMM|nr:DUF4381 domain-containing protein [Gilvimarinus sp. SDUM040014]MDO3382204.1 DUF4381 domain-containing protein [Gilvimarinus sp. SDUM040014]